MQVSFDFAAIGPADDLAFIRRTLTRFFGRLDAFERRTPIWQLIRSLIGSQTYDSIAEAALDRLMQRWAQPADIAKASIEAVHQTIREVTHADIKAAHLVETMRRIGCERSDYNLSFLAGWPVPAALDWLERFPGVGPKVAAATLNASTLGMPVFIVDSHVHRVLLRFGFIGSRATAKHGRDAVIATGIDTSQLLKMFSYMKLLGQTICRPLGPRCGRCPLASRCQRKTELGRPPEEETLIRCRVSSEIVAARFADLNLKNPTRAAGV